MNPVNPEEPQTTKSIPFSSTISSLRAILGIPCSTIPKTGEGLLQRLTEHIKDQKMDFFNEVVVLTTDNNIFGPTELSYLENRFTEKIRIANRYKIKN